MGRAKLVSTYSICDSVSHLEADCPQNSRKFRHHKWEAAKSSAALVTKHRQWPNDVCVEHNAGALAPLGAGVSTGRHLPATQQRRAPPKPQRHPKGAAHSGVVLLDPCLPFSCVMHSKTYSPDHVMNFWTTRALTAAVALSIPACYVMFRPFLRG